MYKEMALVDIYRELGMVNKAEALANKIMEDSLYPKLNVYGAIRLLEIYADYNSEKANELIDKIDMMVAPETKAYEDYLYLKAKYYKNIGNVTEAKKVLQEFKDKSKYAVYKNYTEKKLREGL